MGWGVEPPGRRASAGRTDLTLSYIVPEKAGAFNRGGAAGIALSAPCEDFLELDIPARELSCGNPSFSIYKPGSKLCKLTTFRCGGKRLEKPTFDVFSTRFFQLKWSATPDFSQIPALSMGGNCPFGLFRRAILCPGKRIFNKACTFLAL